MKSMAGPGQGERCPLMEEGDSPGPRLLSLERRQAAPVWRGKAWPSRAGLATGHRPPHSLAARQRPRHGDTYPLVVHGLLRLVQYPLHLLYGHHLIGYKFLSLVSEACDRSPFVKPTCTGSAHGLAPLFLFKGSHAKWDMVIYVCK